MKSSGIGTFEIPQFTLSDTPRISVKTVEKYLMSIKNLKPQ